MIRFCDKEVEIVEYDSLNWKELQEYFASGREENVLCVYDDFTKKRYIGKITSYSLQHSININGAIQEEYVILDKDMWHEARECFAYRNGTSQNNFLLPILNKEKQLICFAYEDEDANREIRQLRELSEISEALQFSDIYPEYKCVKIHEFNELAYFFAMYLASQNVAVQVEGAMWEEFFIGEECLVPDYECLNIYAEGTWEKSNNWKDNLLRSVSVEFECVDKIYEENIRRGTVNDAAYNSTEFFRYLKDKEVILLGTGKEEQAAYDLILGEGVDIYGFVEDNGNKERLLLGKRIMSKLDVINECHNPVFINCTCKNSAWGFGEVDRFDYEGYRRNKNYFLLNDYADIHVSNLHHILRGKNVILVGNLNLCRNVERALKEIKECNIVYWNLLEEYSGENDQFAQRSGENDIYFLIMPIYRGYERECRRRIAEKRKLYLQKLEEKNVVNISEYFSDREVILSIQKKDVEKYTLPCFTPGKILLNISGHMCGNGFFECLLNGHPNILMFDDDVMLRNLFFICMELAEEKAENIKDAFWEIYCVIQHNGRIVQKREIFNEKLEELLTYKKTFTAQELFVILHIAYAKMWGMNISDISTMVIYYEERTEVAHEMRIQLEEWLYDKRVKGFSLNLTRNAYTRMGSFFSLNERNQRRLTYSCMDSVWKYMTFEGEVQKPHKYWKRLVVKFETLKTAPKETLTCICKELGIEWEDCLLETTWYGNMVASYQSGNDIITGFDLKPVYNLYEQYFSDFDRFRINMIFSRAQNRFDYPYVSCQNFSRRQLQEMLLKKFRFENKWSYEEAKQYRKIFVNKASIYFQKARMEEIMCKNEADSLWSDIKIP